MQCPHCSMPVSETDRFCETCGSPLQPSQGNAAAQPNGISACRCPPGESLPDEDGYCQICGLRVTAAHFTAATRVELAVDQYLAVTSDIGRRHLINQDAGIVCRRADGAAILVVADGVSTSVQADKASLLAIETARQVLATAPPDEPLEVSVERAVSAANTAVIALPYHTQTQLDEPETTIVVALMNGPNAAIAWVGDSRAYLIAPPDARLLTQDDSWFVQAVASGELSAEQALTDPRAHVITQCLGMRDARVEIHTIDVNLSPDHRLLLCTDGLWNYLEEPETLAKAVADTPADTDALGLCRHLVRLANEAGGKDNITVAVLLPGPRT